MNEILGRALNFANQSQENLQPADQEAFYQEKYIAALEEKLKITQERDTMAAILEEKNSMLESLIKYSAELERKLGISQGIIDQGKFMSWIDVVRKYFKSFNDSTDDYEMAVEKFIRDHNVDLKPVRSDSCGNISYGIPSSLHVEFAAYFSDLWQKNLQLKKRPVSTDHVADVNANVLVGNSQEALAGNGITPQKRKSTDDQVGSKVVEEEGDVGTSIISSDRISLSESGTNSGNISNRSSPMKSVSSSNNSSPRPVQIDIEAMDVDKDRAAEPEVVVIDDSIQEAPSPDDSKSIQINSEASDQEYPSRSSPRLVSKEQKESPKKNLELTISTPNRQERNMDSPPSRSFTPIVANSPSKDGAIKEHKIKGITMYIWLDFLNAYFPDAVKTMKRDKELYRNAKSAVKRFLTDNYPSIGLSFKEMQNQKLLYIPKSFEVTFKSWFKEEFNSAFEGQKSCGSKNLEENEPIQPLQNDHENISATQDEPEAHSEIILAQESTAPPKKSKSKAVRYNLILKDLFPDFHSQTKTSRGRIRNSVKEYLSEKVESLEDYKLFLKDREGRTRVSYGIPREFLDDFQKWALVQLREEYGEIVPLATWER